MADKILEAARERGIELGGSVGKVPEIWDFAKPYWEAFHLASRRRPYYVGMGGALPGPIPVETIRAVAPLFGFSENDREFVHILDAMDVEYLRLAAENRSPSPTPRGR